MLSLRNRYYVSEKAELKPNRRIALHEFRVGVCVHMASSLVIQEFDDFRGVDDISVDAH
jgi:hypothetical protein